MHKEHSVLCSFHKIEALTLCCHTPESRWSYHNTIMPVFLLLLFLIVGVYVYCVLIIRACPSFSGSSEFTTISQPYDQLEASIKEFVEDGLHTSEAVTEDETSGAIVCGNRLFGPQSIRHQSSRGVGIDLHHHLPRVIYLQLRAMCSVHITYTVLLYIV